MSDTTAYDVFLSYARKDNAPIPEAFPQGWVTAIYEHILAEHRTFSTERLRIFFDTQEIKDLDDWRFRILGALKHSKMLLICLSPNYFASAPCRWEWEEYIQRQVHQLMGSDSVATVYFVEVPGGDEQANARRLEEILRGNFTDIRPWFPVGARALREAEVQARMKVLGGSLWERLQRARRAMAAPGNLRWQNPHFVGRREELRKLHEQLGTGAVGVVTAVHGLGGQGKTELAVAYAHGWADAYPAGLWSLGAEHKKELLPLIGELAWDAALGFTPNEAQKNDPVLLGRGVLEHLKQRAAAAQERDPDKGAAALLLLDNVSEPDLLSAAQLATLPAGMGAGWLRIVATTRLEMKSMLNRLALLAVDALDEESALSLVRDHQPPRDAQRQIVTDPRQGEPQFASAAEEAAAREIVRALGGFTLAVEQVALYLGLHPEIAPSAFLETLQARGLPVADTLVERDADLAAQMLTQSKQLGLILDATLAKLAAPARTALGFAALLPPDSVPWPWLRSLTVGEHPELGRLDDLGADPWLAVQRRLSGLRLLTPGDHPQVGRIHRLVAAHLQRGTGFQPVISEGHSPAQGNALGSQPPHEHRPERAAQLEAWLEARANVVAQSQDSPIPWELDALSVTLPHLLWQHPTRGLAASAGNLSEKVKNYRSLPAAAALMATCHKIIERLAESDPANAAWQRDLSVSLDNLGELAVAQGNLPEAQRLFGESLRIAQRLAESDPANAAWQRDLSVSLIKLGDLAVAQGNLPEAQRLFDENLRIAQRLAESDPANAAWQRDLSVSLEKLGDLAVAQGNLPEAQRLFSESLRIRQRLAESDPANAAWQRDLSVSHFKFFQLAQKLGDEEQMQAALRACFLVLDSMHQRGLHLDPAIANLYPQLTAMFGG